MRVTALDAAPNRHTATFRSRPLPDIDIGVLTTEPGGAVRIRVVREAGTEDSEPKLHQRRDGAPLSTTIAPGLTAWIIVTSWLPVTNRATNLRSRLRPTTAQGIDESECADSTPNGLDWTSGDHGIAYPLFANVA